MVTINTGKLPNKPYRVVIHGQEGVGKSTLASKFPKPLFIDVEGSTDRMDVARTEKPKSWANLLQQINDIRKSPPAGYKTLVIDTVDWAQRLCATHIIECNPGKDGELRDSIESFGYGRGYTLLAEEFGRLLDVLSELRDSIGWNIVLVCHTAIRKFELPEEEGAYDRWEMKLERRPAGSTSCFSLVKEWSELLLFACYKTIVSVDDQTKKAKVCGEQRILRTEHSAAWDAKNRDNLPPELPMEWKSIAHLFQEPKPAAAKPAPIPAKQPVPPAPAPPAATQAPVPKPEPAPPAPAGTVTAATMAALQQLMNGVWPEVTEPELMAAVHKAGHFPADMPLSNLPEEYVAGRLVANWDKVYKVVERIRKEELAAEQAAEGTAA
jgi:hypothetical protein